MTTWAEIQRLAADLQRVQLAEGVKRLSENNCVEVVTKLISLGAVDIVVSSDGKEYITRKHLLTEIKNECFANNNKIAITELASRLNVEVDHIDNAVAAISRQSDAFILCAGEIIHRDYISDLCEKLNSRLREMGQVSMLQLTRNWDLSTEILNNHILPEIGCRIRATKFEDQLYTHEFLDNTKHKLCATLSALTKVLPISVIQSHLNIGQSLFFMIWNQLMDQGHIPGQLLGSKNSIKSLYIPNIHLQNVKVYARKSLLEASLIECAALKKLGVSDSPQFLKDTLPKEDYNDIIFLSSVIIHKTLMEELEAVVEDAIKEKLYCKWEDVLSSSLSDSLESSDSPKIAELLLTSHPQWRSSSDGSILYNPNLLDIIIKSLHEYVSEKAKTDAPAILSSMRSNKQNPATKKASQNTEDDWDTGKSHKKKGAKKGSAKAKTNVEEDPDTPSMTLKRDEILEELAKSSDIPDTLVDEFVDAIEDACNAHYRESVENAMQLANTAGAEAQRKALEASVLQIRKLYTSICAFEDGTALFEGSLCDDLRQYLLKNSCAEFANAVLATFIDDPNIPTLSQKTRDDLINGMRDAESRNLVKNLFDSLQSLDSFHEAVFGLRSCSILIKQPDKASRQEFASNYSAELETQLTSSSDPAVSLLLVVLLILHKYHKTPVNASGKFVAPLTTFLVAKNGDGENALVPSTILDLVLDTQQLVVARLRKAPKKKQTKGGEEDSSAIDENIANLKAFLCPK
ncbi:e3 UFM1-protein ligase 1 domain-containing protein [Ditylenchus destructor]|nr:e3 UFM1-protein ligase 1 domain-containing protein [Ditylenchus destructor]